METTYKVTFNISREILDSMGFDMTDVTEPEIKELAQIIDYNDKFNEMCSEVIQIIAKDYGLKYKN